MDPTKMTDDQLINWLTQDQTTNVPLGELTRRNTKAIHRFNWQSTLLSAAMIIIAIASLIVAVILR